MKFFNLRELRAGRVVGQGETVAVERVVGGPVAEVAAVCEERFVRRRLGEVGKIDVADRPAFGEEVGA